LVDAGLERRFQDALAPAEAAYDRVAQRWPLVAEYLVTHAHNRRVLTKINLRECYHLFKLRTSEMAHFAIRGPMLEAMKQAVEVHPELFRYLRLRDHPAWWPFPVDAA
jgi:thymidylate synthase ThyX